MESQNAAKLPQKRGTRYYGQQFFNDGKADKAYLINCTTTPSIHISGGDFMAIAAAYNFDGCICKIDDSYIESRTQEQREQDRKRFEETVSRLYTEQEILRIMNESRTGCCKAASKAGYGCTVSTGSIEEAKAEAEK